MLISHQTLKNSSESVSFPFSYIVDGDLSQGNVHIKIIIQIHIAVFVAQ